MKFWTKPKLSQKVFPGIGNPPKPVISKSKINSTVLRIILKDYKPLKPFKMGKGGNIYG